MTGHNPNDLTTISFTDLEADLLWGVLKDTEQAAIANRNVPEFAWLLEYLPDLLDKVKRAP